MRLTFPVSSASFWMIFPFSAAGFDFSMSGALSLLGVNVLPASASFS